MPDREIGLTGIQPQKATHVPAEGKARVECERTVNQPDRRVDMLPEYSQHFGGMGEDARVVFRPLERLPRKIHRLRADWWMALPPSRQSRVACGITPPTPAQARKADRSRSPVRLPRVPSDPALSLRDGRQQPPAGKDRR